MKSQWRIAISAILTAPLVGVAVLATVGQPHSTKLTTFTEPARLPSCRKMKLAHAWNLKPLGDGRYPEATEADFRPGAMSATGPRGNTPCGSEARSNRRSIHVR
jgi:hypothetical protein